MIPPLQYITIFVLSLADRINGFILFHPFIYVILNLGVNQINILQDTRFLFTVTSVNEVQKTATCVLRSTTDEEFCKAVLSRWVPSVEDEGLKSVEIKNNDIVVLQVFFNQKSLFIRPASVTAKEVFSRLIQDVGHHCIKGIFQIEKSDTTNLIY